MHIILMCTKKKKKKLLPTLLPQLFHFCEHMYPKHVFYWIQIHFVIYSSIPKKNLTLFSPIYLLF